MRRELNNIRHCDWASDSAKGAIDILFDILLNVSRHSFVDCIKILFQNEYVNAPMALLVKMPILTFFTD